jgi:hypothetical protein
MSALAQTYDEDLSASGVFDFLLNGGYDALFGSCTGWTVFHGSLSIGSCSSAVEGVELW